MLTADGSPMSTITVEPLPPSVSSAGSNATVCLMSVGTKVSSTEVSTGISAQDVVRGDAYEFGPTGATFNPPMTMTIAYDPATIPAGVSETSLFLAFFDTAANQWAVLPGSVDNPVTHTVSAPVSHFTLYSVMAPRPTPASVVVSTPNTSNPTPANMIIQSLIVAPPRILVGQSSDIIVTVTNKGGLPGDYIVVIKLDGKALETRSGHLNPGQSTEVYMTLKPGTNGIYTISTGPLANQLVVNPLTASDVTETDYWWLLCISIGISTLIFSLVRRQRRVKETLAGIETDEP